ncbi:hypothetical protein WJX82_006688 [Trebouxia sp. C0006]
MSDTSAKQDRDDDDQGLDVEVNGDGPDAEAGDEEDDALDAALFGEDEEGAEAEPAGVDDATNMEDTAEPARVEVSSPVPGDQAEDLADQARQQADERNKIIMNLMTQEQLERYEAFRRSAVNKGSMKRVLQTVSGQVNISDKIVTVMRGIAKVYVGELVEAARLFAHESGDSGPLQPVHYQAAYQQLNSQGKVPHKSASKKLKL